MSIYEFLLKFADEHPILSFLAIYVVGELGRIGSHRTEVKITGRKEVES